MACETRGRKRHVLYVQVADRPLIYPTEDADTVARIIILAVKCSIANYIIGAIIIACKVGILFTIVTYRVPGCALQINIRSLLEVVTVEVAVRVTIGITVGGIAAIDVIRQRLQIGGGTDKPRVVLRAAAPAQKFIGGGG